MASNDDELYRVPAEITVCNLACEEAFSGLTSQEKQYTHAISQASWAGALICLQQTSTVSPPLFRVIIELFSNQTVPQLRELALQKGVSAEDFTHFLNFIAMFLGNMGNYLSFGDTKFVPRLSKEVFREIFAAAKNAEALLPSLDKILDEVYDLSGTKKQLGLEHEGVSSYYSEGITKVEIERVQRWLASTGQGDQAYNTRLFRRADEGGKAVYELLIASAETAEVTQVEFEGVIIRKVYGDHAPFLSSVVESLARAQELTSNTHQQAMHAHYVKAFKHGNISDHKNSQREWVKDKGPAVECNIGFIESYRDPFGVRGEWEGFVAVVNRAMSVKFTSLVESAERFISMLPWPKEFEKDTFLRPDFTSLDVVSFASSGIPAGINIPNYDDIRQSEGFKNVSLGNVLGAASSAEKLPFLHADDDQLFRDYRGRSFEVQVGLHELLGHGSGKLLVEAADGSKNFPSDLKNPLHPEETIATWYQAGDTWDAKFGAISSSYEECRAECVGIYLCTIPEVLTLFGHADEAAQKNVVYINWLLMCRAGLLGLEYYSPATQTWRQAHMQARWAILRVLLEAGQGLVSIVQDASLPFGAEVRVDASKIESVGRPAIAAFLQKLNVYKSTADTERGSAMYKAITSVPEDMLPLRQLVIQHKQPRKIFVQAVTRLEGEAVVLQSYADSPEGLIGSFVDRFGSASSPLSSLVKHL